MKDSLIEELPKIVERGKKEAQKLLDGLSKSQRITLQTNELVLPTKAKGGLTAFVGQIGGGESKFRQSNIKQIDIWRQSTCHTGTIDWRPSH
jgi:hypothetical protein